MASKMAMRITSPQCRLPSTVKTMSSLAARRSVSSVTSRSIAFARTSKPQQLSAAALHQSFRRTYATVPPPPVPTGPAGPDGQVGVPPPAPKRRFRVLRWLWRITYLSLLGGAGYIAYIIYDGKHPNEQFDPDPSKKTLVILGKSRKEIDHRMSC